MNPNEAPMPHVYVFALGLVCYTVSVALMVRRWVDPRLNKLWTIVGGLTALIPALYCMLASVAILPD